MVADPHEIANVWGTQAWITSWLPAENLPLDFFFMLPSCVPASPLGTAGAIPSTRTAWRLTAVTPGSWGWRGHEFSRGRGGEARLCSENSPLTPGARWTATPRSCPARPSKAYRLTGVGSDHECTELPEAREKLRLGFRLMLREGSLAKNLADLLPAVTPASLRRFCWSPMTATPRTCSRAI